MYSREDDVVKKNTQIHLRLGSSGSHVLTSVIWLGISRCDESSTRT